MAGGQLGRFVAIGGPAPGGGVTVAMLPGRTGARDVSQARRGDIALTIAGEVHGGLAATAGQPTHVGKGPAGPALGHWQQFGLSPRPELNGVYALALQTPGQSLLTRDASGLQNLFWHRSASGRTVAASDLGLLREHVSEPLRISRAGLHEYLRFLDIAAPRTLFEGVSAVEAGHWLVIHDDGAVQLDGVASGSSPSGPIDFEDAVDQLEARLRAAVEARLSACARPALLLSGGVDSALIAAMAVSLRPDTTALTVGFDDPELDESPVAGRIAAHLGMAHEVLRIDRAAWLGAFERAAAGMEQPTADPSLPATILALDHCRERFDVVLDGTGADESVGAMPLRHLRLVVALGSRVPGAWRRRLVQALRAVPALATHAPLFDFEHPAEPFIRWGGFGREEAERLCGEPVTWSDTQFFRTFERFPRRAHFARYSALVDAMPCERVNQAMRVSGVRMRFPFTDPGVNGFIRQLPVGYRTSPTQPKRILRALLARYLPRAIWDGPKRGFTFPLESFLTAEQGRFVRDWLDPDRWRRLGLLSPDQVGCVCRDYLAGDRRLFFRAWALAVLGAWLEHHDDVR